MTAKAGTLALWQRRAGQACIPFKHTVPEVGHANAIDIGLKVFKILRLRDIKKLPSDGEISEKTEIYSECIKNKSIDDIKRDVMR